MNFWKSLALLLLLSLVVLLFSLVVTEKQPGMPDQTAKLAIAQETQQDSNDTFAGESESIKVRLRRLIRQRQLKNWESVAGVIDEIAELRPKNAETWRYLAWSCGYDVVYEMKDSSTQYDWVKRGIALLLTRLDTHPSEPEILWELGRLTGQQLDRLGFRQKFANDVEFQKTFESRVPIQMANGPDGKCHCRLVARLCFVKAVEASDNGKNEIMMPVLFCSYPAKCSAEFVRAIEQDGYCGEEAVQAWQAALKEWRKLGEQEFESPDGIVQLNPRPGEDKWAKQFRIIANYDYWIEKCEVEQSNQLRSARKLLYDSHRNPNRLDENNLQKSKATFDDAFVAWNAVLAQHGPLFEEDYATQQQLRAASDAYAERFYQETQTTADSPLHDLKAWLETQPKRR